MRGDHRANAVEHSLLLPKDMPDLRSMRQHEVFLGLKRDLAMVSQFLFLFYIYILIVLFFPSRPSKPHLGLSRW